MKKLLCCFAAVLFCFSFALTGVTAAEAFVIDKFDVAADVSEDNSIRITETIAMDFSASRHGIILSIPYISEITGVVNGTTQTERIKIRISDVNVVGEEFSTSKSDGNLEIKIGSADAYVYGKKTYTVSYTMHIAADNISEYDYFYLNLIGTQWDCPIYDASFVVNMPKDFDDTLVKFTSGSLYSTNENNVSYTVSGNTITGSLINPLSNYQGVTIKVQLPDGYFSQAESSLFTGWVVALIISVFILALVIVFYLKYGIDPKLYPTVEFYPPDEITPAEAGYIIDGVSDDKDIISLIIYWADKGYLTIKELKKNEFELTKIRDLDENAKSYEKTAFKGLFKKSETVHSDYLKKKYYDYLVAAKASLSNSFKVKSRRLTESASDGKQIISMLLCVLIFFINAAVYYYDAYYDVFTAALSALFPGTVILFLLSVFAVNSMAKVHLRKRVSTVILLSVLITLFTLLQAVYGVIFSQITAYPIWPYLCGVLCSVAVLILSVFMSKRSEYGNMILGRVIGFKNFMEAAEKERLELLVNEDPSYFYKIMPYAYVLGVSSVWIKKFESIAMQPPTWYYSPYQYPNMLYFNTRLLHSVQTIGSNMSVPPVQTTGGSIGGGFSSGGGFSGGGFGGGGGRSW